MMNDPGLNVPHLRLTMMCPVTRPKPGMLESLREFPPQAGLHVMMCPDLIEREIWDRLGPLSVGEQKRSPLKGV